jgi:hypothetical protein
MTDIKRAARAAVAEFNKRGRLWPGSPSPEDVARAVLLAVLSGPSEAMVWAAATVLPTEHSYAKIRAALIAAGKSVVGGG